MAPPRASQSSEPKSGSSNIVAAFKSLTNLKRSPASSNSFSTLTPDGSAANLPNEPTSAPPTPLASKDLEGTFTPGLWGRSLNAGDDDKLDGPVVGPPQLKSLVEHLGPGHALNERINAADTISTLLDEYVVGNVGTIWIKAKDLLESGDREAGFKSAYNLLLACMNHSGLRVIERPLLFASTFSDVLVARPSLCIEALSILTNNGKVLDALDPIRLASLLVTILDKAYADAASVRRKLKNGKPNLSTIEESTLIRIFKYIIDSIKFSSTIFDACLSEIIKQVLLICKRTGVESDLRYSLEILHAGVTYAPFPKASLRASVEVLCGIRCSVSNLKLQSISTFMMLLRSHLEFDVLNALLAILTEHELDPVQNRNVVRGGVQLLQELIREDSQEPEPRLNVSEILPALRGTLGLLSAGLECDVLETLSVLLSDTNPPEVIFDDTEWRAFSDIVLRCSKGKAATNQHLPSVANQVEVDNYHKQKDGFTLNSFAKTFRHLADQLFKHSYSADADRKLAIMFLLLRVSVCLDDGSVRLLIDYYVNQRLLLPSHPSWIEDCDMIQELIVLDSGRSTELKLIAFEALYAAYSSAEALSIHEASKVALSLIKIISSATDIKLVQRVTDFAVEVAEWTMDPCHFSTVVVTMQQELHSERSAPPLTSEKSFELNATSRIEGEKSANKINSALPIIIANGLVRIFLRCMNKSSEKTEKLFHLLLTVARSTETSTDARVIALKLFVHLRCDVQYAMYVSQDLDSECVIDLLNRAPVLTEKTQFTALRGGLAEDTQSTQHLRDTPLQNAQRTALSGNSGPLNSQLGPILKPIEPIQALENIDALPDTPQASSSRFVYCQIKKPTISPTGAENSEAHRIVLPMALWLDTVLELLQSEELEWAPYSYLISHLGAQLMNHSLFSAADDQIKVIRRVLCDLLQNRSFHEPPPFTKLKKADVSICLYQILQVLVSYHNLFSKAEEDDIVRTFVLGIGSSEQASEICINALSVCCHETPMSIVKYLESALQKMTQVITQSNIAVHILEFLSGLARLPNLFRNFREDEFRSVFGICFRYLQSVREKRQKATVLTNKSPTGPRPQQDTFPKESGTTAPSLSEALPQYVFALTYHVMTFWFMALKLKDRPRQMAWIRQNLIFKNPQGEEMMEEQSQVTIDLMHRVAYSDRDETVPNRTFAQDSDGLVASKSYLVGLSILTVETAGRTGVSHITIRRPSGNKYSVSRPQIAHASPHQVWDNASAYYAPDYVAVTPEDIVQSLYSPLSISPSLASLTEGPIPLPDDEATRRGIDAFDRISALDGHKVGILYIGENQKSEAQILANVMGSPDYCAFLNDLGTLTELQGATFNTQGLDREYGTDGKFTYCWRDRVSELVFHVTTMMPTDLARDPSGALKKRHIGNDFVKIIFNNSGTAFDFDTFPSDFNFVNIVISPEARESFMDTRLGSAQRHNDRTDDLSSPDKDDHSIEQNSLGDDVFFKVTVMTKPGLPKTSPASETQIVSGKNLAPFTRLLALNASVFAQVWANRAEQEHVSSWRSRLREIIRLRERHAPSGDRPIAEKQSISQPVTQSQAPASERFSATESIVTRRASTAAFLVDGSAIKENSGAGAAEMERTDSTGSRG